MKKLYFLITTIILSIDLYGQIGINTKSGTASLNIKEAEETTNQLEDLLLRSKNTLDNDILRINNNGNISIYNDLKFNNDSGSKGNLLVSNGVNTSPNWTNSVEKGLLLQVFNAEQDILDEDEYFFVSKQIRSLFKNPLIYSNVEADIGRWNTASRKFIVNKPGIYEITIGGNFYTNTPLNNPAGSGVYIIIEDGNNNELYRLQGTRSVEPNSPSTIINLSNGITINANAKVYSTTSISLILQPNYKISATYSTGGVAPVKNPDGTYQPPTSSTTFIIPFKTFFNITYTEIPQ